jgi:hypothetical protein
MVHKVMNPNPKASPMMVAFPNGVPPSKGAVAVVDDELIAEDRDDSFVVVGGFVVEVSGVGAVDVVDGATRYPLT